MKILKKSQGMKNHSKKERIIREMNIKERVFWILTIVIMLLILTKS